MQVPPEGLDFRAVMDRVESDLIRQALEITRGNKNRAAQLIGLNRTTMLEKMKKKGVEFDRPMDDPYGATGGSDPSHPDRPN